MTRAEQNSKHADFLVNRTNLSEQKILYSDAVTPLNEQQILLSVDTFALTANNVTYAVVGEAMQYWQFFPCAEVGFGRVPVWGFANVAKSRCEGIEVGDRVYGFLPMSTDFVASPVAVSEKGFIDGVEHRRELHQIYNQYVQVNADPSYVAALEAQQMLLRPLFMTSFLIEDFLRENVFFGADQIVLSSASSKTAIGTAYQLAHADQRPDKLVGLTSAGNCEFVRGLGLYDSVLAYEEIECINAKVGSVLVDMAGNGDVLQRLHGHVDGNLKYSCRVGAAHWDSGPPASLAGPKPQWFFAPAQFQQRSADIGSATLLQQFATAWGGFVQSTGDWMTIVERQGASAIQETFNEMLEGRATPSSAYILSF